MKHLERLEGRRFKVVSEEDGETYSGFIKSVSKNQDRDPAQKTLHVVFYNADGEEEWFDRNLPLLGPGGFFYSRNGAYTLTD